tara:strand:- start:254 stop:592 length:339 start_codon:yes stop_codon:yes gene_type:complete
MSKKNDNRLALLIIGSIIGGIIVGGVAGARLGFGYGIELEQENQLENSLEDKKAFASQLKLVFNDRIENVSSELVGLCSDPENGCIQNTLDAMLIALDDVKVDESIINELLE